MATERPRKHNSETNMVMGDDIEAMKSVLFKSINQKFSYIEIYS